MTEVDPPAVENQEEPAPERQSTPFLVLQFFIFPLAIVAVCVTVFVVFGLIAAEHKGAHDYLNEVRSGSVNTRWQAAYELSRVLQDANAPARSDPRFAEEAIRLFEDTSNDDPRVRQYLALALGRLGDHRAVPALLKVVEAAPQEGAVQTQIYALWALGAIADTSALPNLVRVARGEDRELRKAAVHALGSFAADDARNALIQALRDPVEDVRWNAALALARRGDPLAVPTLSQMMSRAHLATVEGLRPDQREDAILQAVAASAGLDDPGLRATLDGLREDPNLKVREAAQASLQAKHR